MAATGSQSVPGIPEREGTPDPPVIDYMSMEPLSTPDPNSEGDVIGQKSRTCDNYSKQLSEKFKQLRSQCDEINSMIVGKRPTSDIEQKYADWQNLHHEFMQMCEEYFKLLSKEEYMEYAYTDFELRDVFLRNFKSTMNDWFQSGKQTVSQKDSISQVGRSHHSSRGSRVSSRASTLSSARLREEQKQAGLSAKMALMAKKRQLELAKVNLKMQEEELEITTEMAISDARTKVIDRHEQSDVGCGSKQGEGPSHMKGTGTEDRNVKSADPGNVSSNKPVLNPIALPFVSRHVFDVHSDCPESNVKSVHSSIYGISTDIENVNRPRAGVNTHDTVENMSHVDSNLSVKQKCFVDSDEQCVRQNAIVNDQSCHMPNSFSTGLSPVAKSVTGHDYLGASVVRHLRKPTSELRKFDGNCMEYRKFLRQFNAKIVANSDNDDEKMNFLEQFTIGEAHRVVAGFSHLDATTGYKAAMRELEDRYGDNEVIADAYIKKALDWPHIRGDDAKGLDQFALFLVECENAVNSIEALRVLEYGENMKRLIGKLPYYLHDRWRNLVMQVKRENGAVAFSHLVGLVKDEAKKANHPVYGKDAITPCQNRQRGIGQTKQSTGSQVNRSRGTFATFETEVKSLTETSPSAQNKPIGNGSVKSQDFKPNAGKSCLYCNSTTHLLEKCKSIGKLPPKERFSFMKTKGLCFGCLRFGHVKTDCLRKATCDSCGGKHPTVLHVDSKTSVSDGKADVIEKTTICGHTGAGVEMCAMAIIPVRVKLEGKPKSIVTYAFFDTGSSVSFCSDNLVRQLGCQGKQLHMTLNTMGTPCTLNTTAVTGLQVYDLDETSAVDLPRVYTKDKMPVTHDHIPSGSDVERWTHLQDIQIPKLDVEIGLMIGNNVPDAFSPLEFKTGPAGSPHATRTRLGWIIWNVVRQQDEHSVSNTAVVNRAEIMAINEAEELKKLDKLLRDSINFDFPERLSDNTREYSQDDKKFLEQCESSVHMIDGHYCMDLPFRNKNTWLPNNKSLGIQRLSSLKGKLQKNEQFYKDDVMNKIINKGYAERVPNEDLDRDDGRVWYIPHHGIYHPKKPQKIRVVFDCTASFMGVSLNSQLLQGPDLTNTLLGVLLRFRQGNIAVMSDVESMFYQVRVSQDNIDCLRFFWWPDGDLDSNPVPYRMLVHIFGAISSPSCSNFALRRTVDDNMDRFNESIIRTVRNNMYVDDYLGSADSEPEAATLIQGATEICQKGGFRLTKWVSSNVNVMESVPESERSEGVKQVDLECGALPNDRALGVYWFIEQDCLGFKIQVKEKPFTRRGILSVTSSVYDPIGIASPFILKAKILLQDLCKRDLKWDEEITGSDSRKWKEWLTELPNLEGVTPPRCYKSRDFGKIVGCQLHTFCDASQVGYGTVSYLRLTDEDKTVTSSFVIGKSRVAPLKKITIPRMELTAASLAVRLSSLIVKELDYPIDKCYFWTDSMATLRYISNENTRFHIVANRVAVIRDATSIDQWRYVATGSNPADSASRGLEMKKFLADHQWIHGPSFLIRDPEEWPTTPEASRTLPENDVEVKSISNATVSQPSTQPMMDRLLAHFSEWTKLKKVVGWMLMAIDNLKARVAFRKGLQAESQILYDNPDIQLQKTQAKLSKINEKRLQTGMQDVKSAFVSMNHLKQAEKVLIQYVQRQHFSEELQALEQRDTSTKKLKRSSAIRKLDPALTEGLLRVGGRLEAATVSFDAKHPILLPRQSHVSRLILEDIHKRVGHLGKNAVLAVLCQKYWMVGATAAIKKMVHHCLTCRRYQGPSSQQKMANLPCDRLTPDNPPFTRTGMDFFGPFEVKRGRSILKRYGVIFTCLSVRAVHLEVASTLTTDSCINAIRRFIARRGPVESILSDNGTNLVGAERELREEIKKWNTAQIRNVCSQKGISWHFNPPAASHFGGIWERMIKTVRKVLFSVMREQVIRFDDEALQTLFCEVEAIINGRPLTESPDSPDDLDVITPNHLLLLRPGEYFPPGTFRQTDVYSRRRWLQVQFLADVFWSRWIKEYIPLLQTRQKWLSPKRNITVGDVVLVVENTPRNSWCMGRILEVFKDRHGLVRSAKVKTKSSELLRPVAKLCLLLEGDV